jgi:hypothetical protein
MDEVVALLRSITLSRENASTAGKPISQKLSDRSLFLLSTPHLFAIER